MKIRCAKIALILIAAFVATGAHAQEKPTLLQRGADAFLEGIQCGTLKDATTMLNLSLYGRNEEASVYVLSPDTSCKEVIYDFRVVQAMTRPSANGISIIEVSPLDMPKVLVYMVGRFVVKDNST